VVHRIRAVDNQAALAYFLLRMSFLERLQGYEFRDGTLTLRP